MFLFRKLHKKDFFQLSPMEHLYVRPTSIRAVIYNNVVLVCFCRPVLPSITGGQWRSAVRWIQWEPVMWLCRTSVPMLSIHLVEPVSIFLTHTKRNKQWHGTNEHAV